MSSCLEPLFTFTRTFMDDLVLTKNEKNDDIRNLRILSLNHRITGVFMGTMAAIALCSGVAAAVTGSVGFMLLNGAVFLCFAIVAHDFIQVGNNINKIAKMSKPDFAGLKARMSFIWKAIVDGHYEDPYQIYDGTIIFGPVQRLFAPPQNNQPADL